jgi:hypothetical protein
MKTSLLFLSLILICLVSCNNRNSKIAEMKNIIENNCNCSKVVIDISKNDTIETIAFNIYDNKNGYDYKEADRILSILKSNIDGFCNMDEKINLQFVTNDGLSTKYFPYVYWKCTLQFEF